MKQVGYSSLKQLLVRLTYDKLLNMSIIFIHQLILHITI
jgi:hypothetical protein